MASVVKKNSKKKRTGEIVSILVCFYISVLIVSGIFGDMGLLKNYNLYKQNKFLKTDIAKLETENRNLRMEIDNLIGNPRYIEKLAREELGMGQDGELTFVFSDK